MSKGRYGKDKAGVYKEFVKHAQSGDKILRNINNNIIKYGNFSSYQRYILHSLLNSNLFLTQFKLPFKYKLPLLKTDISEGKYGDMVEAYICWRYVNYGAKSAERYVEDQIIKITNKYK